MLLKSMGYGKKAFFKITGIEKMLFAVVGVLLAAVLGLSAAAHNAVSRSRADGDYAVITDVVYTQIEREGIPAGAASECRFTLDGIRHADAYKGGKKNETVSKVSIHW